MFPKKYFGGLVDVLEAEVSEDTSTFSTSGQKTAFKQSGTKLSLVHRPSVKDEAGNFADIQA